MQGCVFVESLQPVFVDNPKREAIHDAWFKFFRLITFWLQMGFKFVQVSLGKEPLLPPLHSHSGHFYEKWNNN